jgi:uncharacterized membrane protein YdbT with pleckstrin-like domain
MAPPEQGPPRSQAPAPGPHAAGDEPLLFQGVCNHSVLIPQYLKWIGVSMLGSAAAWGLGKIEFFATWPLWILGMVGIPGMLWTFLQHVTTKYKITMRRVEWERGVISRSVDSVEMWRVLDLRYSQSLFDRMTGNADICLVSTDQSDPELHLHGLPNHRQLFEKLREAVQAARQSGRPMELVGGQDGFAEHVGGGHH